MESVSHLATTLVAENDQKGGLVVTGSSASHPAAASPLFTALPACVVTITTNKYLHFLSQTAFVVLYSMVTVFRDDI